MNQEARFCESCFERSGAIVPMYRIGLCAPHYFDCTPKRAPELIQALERADLQNEIYRLRGAVYRMAEYEPSAEMIVLEVAQVFNVSPQAVKKHFNSPEVTWPRYTAMHLIRKTMGASYPLIGRSVGKFHHTTVMHGIRKVQERMKTDEKFCKLVTTFERKFSNSNPTPKEERALLQLEA